VKLQTASGARGCKAPRRRDNFVDVAGDDHAHLSKNGRRLRRAPENVTRSPAGTSVPSRRYSCQAGHRALLSSVSALSRGFVLAISAGADRPWTVGKRAGVKSGERKKMIINRSLDTSQ